VESLPFWLIISPGSIEVLIVFTRDSAIPGDSWTGQTVLLSSTISTSLWPSLSALASILTRSPALMVSSHRAIARSRNWSLVYSSICLPYTSRIVCQRDTLSWALLIEGVESLEKTILEGFIGFRESTELWSIGVTILIVIECEAVRDMAM
jgi:hypothetical protein